jgi:hypothetical protein
MFITKRRDGQMPPDRLPNHTWILVIAIAVLFVLGLLALFAVRVIQFMVTGEIVH